MSKILERLAKQAKPVVNRAVPATLPAVKYAIQKTDDYKELASPTSVPDLGYPRIDESAFKGTHWNLRCRRVMPDVAFFDVDFTPEVKAEVSFQSSHGGETKWTANRYQLVDSPDVKGSFSIFKRLWMKHTEGCLQWMTWLTVFLFLSCGWTYIAYYISRPTGLDVIGEIVYTFGWLVGGIISSACIETHSYHISESKTYRAKLGHIITDDILAIIDKAKQVFNRGVYIVADVSDQWEMATKPEFKMLVKPNPDPLIIGTHVDDSGTTHHYLVHKFDLTPKEAFISSAEFVTKKRA